MTRTSFRCLSIAALTLVVCAGRASAQVSEARIQELLRQVNQTPTEPLFKITAPKSPDADGPTVPITLDDAVRFGLERNLDIAVQRLAPELADISIAQAYTAYRPTVTTDISRSSTTSAPTNQLSLSNGGGATTTHNFGFNGTINQQLPWWGGSFRATLNNGRSDSNSNNSTFNPQYSANWTLNYAQPLLRGRTIDQTRRNIVVTKINRDVSDIQLKAQLSNLVSDIKNAYWDYVYAVQAVDVAKQSLALSTKLVEDNKVKVEIGTMAPLEITSAQAEQARSEQSLVTTQNTKRTREITLKRLIVAGTDDPNWLATLDPVDRPQFEPEDIDLEAAMARALNNRTDLAQVRKSIEVNELSLKYLHNQVLPDVQLSTSYGAQGIGGTFLQRSNSGVLGSQITNTIPGGIGDAFSSLFQGRNPRWTLGLNVTWPIGLTTQETQLARANVQVNQIQAQLKKAELQVATDINTAAINLRNSAQSVTVSQKSRELSERRMEAEQSKFDVGMSTNFQVVQAQRDLQDARNAELLAILNYRRSQVEFERAQQTLGNVSITQIN